MTPRRLALSLSAVLAAGLAATSWGCGGSSQTSDAALFPPDAEVPDVGIPDDAAAPGPDAAPTPFQAAVASVLPYPESFTSTTTFRVPFTTVRAGTQVQVALWGGGQADAGTGMTISSAWIGRWLGNGTVDTNTQLHFGGQPGTSTSAGSVAVSDPLDFVVLAGQRYAVSFVATGTVPHALADIGGEGLMAPGDLADRATLTGTSDPAFRGVKYVSVRGAQTRDVAVLGDSIGAGEAAMGVDKRFVDLAQLALGYPVVDSSEGGDGVLRAEEPARLDFDVLALPGITDCLVELGTNDLHQADDIGVDAAAQFITDALTRIYQRLKAAGLRPWGATIIPKGTNDSGVPNLSANGEAARVKVNQFIQSTPLVEGVADFAKAIADPTDPSKPAAGMLSRDGIHPWNAGHQAMADEMVRAFRAAPATSP